MNRLSRGAFILLVVLRYGLDELVLSSFRHPWLRLLTRVLTLGRDLRAPEPHSQYARAVVLRCSQRSSLDAARLDAKRLRSLRHPHVLAHLGSHDTPTELLLAVEWWEPGPVPAVLQGSAEWRAWGRRCFEDARAFLARAALPPVTAEDAVVVTAGGVVKVAPFAAWLGGGPPVDAEGLFGTGDGSTGPGSLYAELYDLAMQYPVLPAPERAAFLRRVIDGWPDKARIADAFRLLVLLPAIVRGRMVPGAEQPPPSLEEARVLFDLGAQLMAAQVAVGMGGADAGVDAGVDVGVDNRADAAVDRSASNRADSRASNRADNRASSSADFMQLTAPLFLSCWARLGHATGSAPLEPWLAQLMLSQMCRASLVALFSARALHTGIFPVLSGAVLQHAHPQVRGLGLHALMTLVPRLEPRLVSNDVLRALARLQGDPVPAIRIAALRALLHLLAQPALLDTEVRARVAGPALALALRDAKCAECRGAALQALATAPVLDLVPLQELAGKLLPLVCPMLLVAEERAPAVACMEAVLQRVKAVAVGAGAQVSVPASVSTVSSTATSTSAPTSNSTATPDSTFTPAATGTVPAPGRLKLGNAKKIA